MMGDGVPRPTRSQPVVRIALAHIARFRSYTIGGQLTHLVFRHNQTFRRIRRRELAELHESLHWRLGTQAHG